MREIIQSYFYHIPEFLKNSSGAKTEINVHSRTFISELSTIVLDGGAKEDRTPDLLRAKQALSQLSYGPVSDHAAHQQLVGLGRFELPTSPLSGVRSNQLSYRPNRLTSGIKQFVWELMKKPGSSIKEVIQPQVPLRLPCYDFTPVMNHSVVTVPPCG